MYSSYGQRSLPEGELMKTGFRQIGRIVFDLGWADDGELWWIDNPKDSVRHWVLFHFAIVERDGFKGLSLMVGKVSLIAGVI